ncbi:MAG: O-antigen ligase family protein [Bryobacterales bacterium]|nr:O-antigen ligase family protein [Bryobacterales bacterium]
MPGASKRVGIAIPALLVLGSLAVAGPPYAAQYAVSAIVFGVAMTMTELRTPPLAIGCLLVIPLLGVWTLDGMTVARSLHWLTLGVIGYVTASMCRGTTERERLLRKIAIAGIGLCLFSTLQFYTSNGDVLWLWPSGEPSVFGTFLSRNNYASVAVLLLPLLLWQGLRKGATDFAWLLAAGAVYGSVVVSGSRAGAGLATVEIPLFLALHRRQERTSRGLWLVVPVLIACAAVTGWDALEYKLQDADPMRHRKDLLRSGVAMVQQSPWVGQGFGAYARKYGAFARFDTGLNVNFAHNDWVELAVEGGLPAVMALAILGIAVTKAVLRQPWALGVPFVFAHAAVDYPLQRLGTALWVFAVAGVAISSGASSSRPRGAYSAASEDSARSSTDTVPAGAPEYSWPQKPIPVSQARASPRQPHQPVDGTRRPPLQTGQESSSHPV